MDTFQTILTLISLNSENSLTHTQSSASRLGFLVYLPMSRLGRAYIADMGHGGKVALDGFDMNAAGIGLNVNFFCIFAA